MEEPWKVARLFWRKATHVKLAQEGYVAFGAEVVRRPNWKKMNVDAVQSKHIGHRKLSETVYKALNKQLTSCTNTYMKHFSFYMETDPDFKEWFENACEAARRHPEVLSIGSGGGGKDASADVAAPAAEADSEAEAEADQASDEEGEPIKALSWGEFEPEVVY